MRRFARLFNEVDSTNRTNEKVAALVRYFAEAPPADAAWTIALIAGGKIIRAVPFALLRALAAEASTLPAWMIDESYHAVGDLSETLALLVPDSSEAGAEGTDLPLSTLIEQFILPLPRIDKESQRRLITKAWAILTAPQRFLFHKLISSAFRMGVSRSLLIRGLAEHSGMDAAVIAHRLSGGWKPSAENYLKLVSAEVDASEPGRPYPFCLAHPLQDDLASLGPPADWQVEWKWDGIRAQLIRRAGRALLWSRGDEMISDSFPELIEAGAALPEGTVLDGEILAWENDRPLPFAELQRRINRKQVNVMLFADVPVVFLAYDLLEEHAVDLRPLPMGARRARLEALMGTITDPLLRVPPLVEVEEWPQAMALLEGSRQRRVEGLMLKRRDSPYVVGRARGAWWKLKIDPYTIDTVLVAAQPGSGRRSSVYTDYTFAVRDGEQFVTIAKAYSGLTDAEIAEVDRWVRRHTIERHGPVRVVKPELVFELAFEAIQESTRHKAGLALRFPRIAHWRRDKPVSEIDTLDSMRALLKMTRR